MVAQPLFDRARLHHEAAKALDRRGLELLGLAQRKEFTNQSESAFQSRREPSAHITDKDVVGEIKSAYTDITGKVRQRFFVENRQEVALTEEGYEKLRRLSEQILSTPPFKTGFSTEFIEETVFDWWADFVRQRTTESLSDRLCKSAESAVQRHHLIVPISAVQFQAGFQFGDILVTPMDRNMIAGMFDQALKNHPENREEIERVRNKQLQELAHLTAVHSFVVGEPIFAEEQATNAAFDMASVLRFMSPAALTWNVGFPCYPHGSEHVRSRTLLRIQENSVSGLSGAILDKGLLNWMVSTDELHRYMEKGFKNLSALFEERPISDFQEKVRSSIFVFSEGVGSFDANIRLVYAMSALENLFLGSEQEPIQNSVGERLAFILSDSGKERREILANFKKAYKLRSKQVHHLGTVDDEDTLSKFFQNAWIALHRAMELSLSFKTKSEFLDKIDEVKFGG